MSSASTITPPIIPPIRGQFVEVGVGVPVAVGVIDVGGVTTGFVGVDVGVDVSIGGAVGVVVAFVAIIT